MFTLIQKFNDPNAEPIVSDHDIVILSDEAHRTNNGTLAQNMVRMLPTASRLGFTGTPLFSYDTRVYVLGAQKLSDEIRRMI